MNGPLARNSAAAPGIMLAGLGRAQLRTLALIRWVAIAGQTATILVVHFGFEYPLPLIAAMATVCASALANILFSWRDAARTPGEVTVAGYFAFDIIQLAILLYLTGGLQNPFVFLLLAPVAVSAAILSLRSIAALAALAMGAITVLALWHEPLPWPGAFPPFPLTYVLGLWAALVFGILFFAVYTFRVADEARRLSEALNATQMALAREQRLSAMGTLAAAAAHELGSPLGTIAVAAGEIARDLPPESPLAEDVNLLLSETMRCRDILAALAQRPEGDSIAFSDVPFSAIMEQAAALHQIDEIGVNFVAATENPSNSAEPRIHSVPEIIHGIGNLVQNAIQFAVREVRVETRWSDEQVTVVITDDGPGFSQLVLDRIGEPYISARQSTGENHMGLGIFIAQTLLERTGARLIFRNAPAGGASVTVNWDRHHLETAPELLENPAQHD